MAEGGRRDSNWQAERVVPDIGRQLHWRSGSSSVTRIPVSVGESTRHRVGIVGAGRSRQGLGPFLARWFEHHGATVVGIHGRDRGRTDAVAVSLAEQLGHPVAVSGLHELAASVDALVVACPVEGHLAGLDAALQAGVACLCEKPLVAPAQLALALERIDRFRRRGLLLAENCQWPFALDAVRALRPDLLRAPPRTLAMRLSPAWPGRAMVEDSLSHVLSLLQALAPLASDVRAVDVRAAPFAADCRRNVVAFRVVDGSGVDVALELHLECCPQQPRPAWFAIDGVRFDRRIGDGYAISFATDDGRAANVEDPLSRLVYGFVEDLQASQRERTEADSVECRMRLYAGILAQLD